MVEFIEFEEKYKDKVIDFWIDICVNEFGFHEWADDIKNMDNDTYKNDNGNFWIAIDNDEVVGTISLKNIGNHEAILKGMYVKKEYRKNKIASRLMNTLLDFAKQNEYKKIELDTYEKFQDAIRFYKKYGFIEKQKENNKYIFEKNIEQ